MSAQPLIRLRCGVSGCRETVLELDEAPVDWNATYDTSPCPRHDGVRRRWWTEVARLRAKGLDPKPTYRKSTVEAADLRHLIYLAQEHGKTQEDIIDRRVV